MSTVIISDDMTQPYGEDVYKRQLIATLHPVEWALLSCMAMITDKKQEPLEEKSGPEETRPEIVEPELPRTVPEAELFARKNGQMSLF